MSWRLAILASGRGSNAEGIMRYFKGHDRIRVVALLSNRSDAGALERAARYGVSTFVFDRQAFYRSSGVLEYLREQGIDYLALAGFLWRVPPHIVRAYRGRIINIHPSLLPSYGGKGMYGMRVHRAVLENGERYSGLTIHYVDEGYDTGEIIFQAKVPVYPDDTPDRLAARILRFEHLCYPPVLEMVIESSEG